MDGAQFCPVGKLEKVLLSTDGSQHSEGAIREAITFAAKCSSRLYTCMALETNPEYETTNTNVLEKEEAEASAHLESIKARAAKEGLRCETIFHEGIDAAQAIVDEAAKIEYRNILVATDGSGHSIAAVQEAINIAKRCGSRIIALSSIRSNDEMEKAQVNVNNVLAMAKSEGITAEGLTPTGRSYNVIVETAGGRGVDLIVMGIPVKSALGKIFTGSATEKVIGTAGCAILIVKGEGSVSATV